MKFNECIDLHKKKLTKLIIDFEKIKMYIIYVYRGEIFVGKINLSL